MANTTNHLRSLVYRLISLPSTLIAQADYTYDDVGNRDTLMETRPTFTITNGLNDFGDDKLNRLLSATHHFCWDAEAVDLRRSGRRDHLSP